MNRNALVTDVSRHPSYSILGERLTVLADHNQTGSYEVYLHDGVEGAGPPPHVHPWDEAFYVISGEVDFDCAGQASRIAAGGFVHVPAGTAHAFRYATATAQVLGFTSGPGAAAMFRDIDLECAGPPQFAQLAEIVGRYGARFVGQQD